MMMYLVDFLFQIFMLKNMYYLLNLGILFIECKYNYKNQGFKIYFIQNEL